jgi:hydroxyacylglutathione hydrolase
MTLILIPKKSFYAGSFLLHFMSQVIDANIGGNSRVFFIKGERTAIVDTGAPGNERNILRALREAGISREQVSLIIITHAHWDHCGSIHALKADLGAPVMAGWPDAEYLERGENVPVLNPAARPIKHASGLNFGGAKADLVVREDMSLQSYGIDARVLATPGHTGGSLSVLASSGDCATGDFLAGLYTGEPAVIEKSLKKMTDGGVKRLYPSHGPDIDATALLSIFYNK